LTDPHRSVVSDGLSMHQIGDLKLSSDCLDFATLNEVGTPHPTNRVHRDHPPIDPLCDSRTSGHLRLAGEGSNLRADHPRFGVKIARRRTPMGHDDEDLRVAAHWASTGC
jgi:hypothetical protein